LLIVNFWDGTDNLRRKSSTSSSKVYHGYLDNPTFRGMRQSLAKNFDEIYIMDLHGNSKRKEVTPDGLPDKNVFDIQQGVAICFMIKYPQEVKI
jgi:predicted helicase